MARPSLAISGEQIVRPFVDVQSTPTPWVPTPPPKENPPAFIRWGAEAQFEGHDFRSDAATQPWLSVGDGNDPEPPKRIRWHYQISRSTEIMIYTNPLDPDQYVVCEEVRSLSGQARENGDRFTLKLKPRDPPIPTEEGNGQEPPEPPPMAEIGERPEWLAWKARQGGGI